jgi:hypothetical protein
MSISQRINKITKEKLNELQAKITLLKKKKLSSTELLDKIISFSIKHEKEFFKFIAEEQQSENISHPKKSFLEFFLSSIEGGGPEDYKEYEYEED